jgi:alkylation response protein AidB-like acyl-CoA dehydrogenase
MADLESFRDDVRTWIAANAPKSLIGIPGGELEGNWGGRKAKYANPDAKRWLDACAERGFTAPEWPREYGGAGLSREETKVLRQEMGRAKVPPPLIGFGLTMIGPTLLMFGNEAQKKEHLPKICRGEIRWCQGYSEPGAGSDLAGLQTRAGLDGDHYNLNGQKIWTSYGDKSDWMFVLVRTDPAAKKQEGISFILFDMETPGVSVKPIKLISGSSPFCETFLTDVKIPKANRVGAEGQGWTIGKRLLQHERTNLSGGGSMARLMGNALSDIAKKYLETDENGQLADKVLRDRIADFEIRWQSFLLTAKRAVEESKAAGGVSEISSVLKKLGTKLGQERAELLIEIQGLRGLGWEGEGFTEGELAGVRAWLFGKATTIYGGSTEIQNNIIAKRVLGMLDHQ